MSDKRNNYKHSYVAKLKETSKNDNNYCKKLGIKSPFEGEK